MSHPDEEILAGLAVGDGAPSPEVAAHVTGCPACASEVDALRRVALLVREGSAGQHADPPREVWDRITAEIAGDSPVLTATSEPGAALFLAPPSQASPSQAPPSQATPLPASPRRAAATPRRPWWWLIGAAAAGLAVGLAGGWALWNQPDPAPVVVASTPLDTLDTRESRGAAEVVDRDTGVALTVRTEPIDAGPGVLEVWLINRDLQRMVSVGVLDGGARSASFPIDQRLLDEGYVIVDISREALDDQPQHSGDSVVRGTLPI